MAGAWWNDGRREWCAYCGLKMRFRKGPSNAKTCATRDHLIPRAERGVVTIPSCRQCNLAKGQLSIDAFMDSPYFSNARSVKRPTQWEKIALLEAFNLAVVERDRLRKPSAESPLKPIPILRLQTVPVYLSQRFRTHLFEA